MAKVLSAKDETVRLFKSDFCEFFSHVHWSIPLMIYLPWGGYFLWKALSYPHFSGASFLLFLGVGAFVWSLIEYLLHRFLFHFQPTHKSFKRFFYIIHQIHHDYPNDSTRLVMPPAMSIPLAFGFYFLFSWLLPPGIFEPFLIGFGLGYLTYDMTHYAVHHVTFKNSWGRYLKKYHLQHHFQEEEKGFGVSSPFWDVIFKTKLHRLGVESSEELPVLSK